MSKRRRKDRIAKLNEELAPRPPGLSERGFNVEGDVDWYALSNGLTTVLPDGTVVRPDEDDKP